jgi:hypothetical protein
MLAHALTILVNELDRHLRDAYSASDASPQVRLGAFAEGVDGASPRDALMVALIRIGEDMALKQAPQKTTRDPIPPLALKLQILISATHADYATALLRLSRVIRFFHAANIFDPCSVAPSSLVHNAPQNPLDRLEKFRLTCTLDSPTLEETSKLAQTFGARQAPFALYTLRLTVL